jgi:cyclohexa-1,5-dienecarbonyl-CoA hydratase
MSTARARLEFEYEERVARITLSAPKANIVDQAMMADLESAFDLIAPRRDVHAIVVSAEGPNFSFGASIQEHLPEQIADTLTRFHHLLRRMVEAPAPTIAAVRGQCLGGGFELVLACDLILAEETAQIGCPEIKLAVFPPAASAILPGRIGAGPAAGLTLTGGSLSGNAAAAAGLVTRTAAAGQLEAALADWLAADFLPRSPAALRHAVRATRRPLLRALEEELPVIERMYLQELMAEPDAVEGIRAFLEKRSPRWGKPGAAA